MAVPLRLDAMPDPMPWESAFLVLGIERCRPAFSIMGLPPAIVASPACVQAAARDFLAAGFGDWQGVQFEPSTLAPLLRRVFAAIERRSGEEPVRELFRWMPRQFVDRRPVYQWTAWADVWRCIAHRALAPRPDADAAWPLEPLDRDVLTDVLRRHVGPEAEQRTEQIFAQIASVWPSSFEERALAMNVVDPTDFPAIDLFDLLDGVVRREQSSAVWTALDQQFDRAALDRLVAWVRRAVDAMIVPDLASPDDLLGRR